MVYDYCITGGGIVGFATAWQIMRLQPGVKLLLLEKENKPGQHQTGHNSGVIHAGIYYAPGSLKANLCRSGLRETKQFCQQYHIPYHECGKLIVATNQQEEERIDQLYTRALANDLVLDKVGKAQLGQLEPKITGISALLSSKTSIVDFSLICQRLASLITDQGADVCYNSSVSHISETAEQVEIVAGENKFHAKYLVACAGLQSDRLAEMAGLSIDFRIIPFRGEYFQLPEHKNRLISHLIYPAPDPALPFLGVHLTRMIDGSVTVGPNAVMSFSREGYAKGSFSLLDTVDFMRFPGFWKLIYQHRRHTVQELGRSLSKALYLQVCQKYCPTLSIDDLLPYRAGIRAQAVMHSGEAVHDFLFKQTERMLHVCNAPSPAATSALPIGKMIARKCIHQQ